MLYALWKKQRKKNFRLNTVLLTKVKLKSINDFARPARESNKLRGDAVMSGDVYVFDDTHDKTLEIIFQGNNYITMN